MDLFVAAPVDSRPLTGAHILLLREWIEAAGFDDEVPWSESCEPPYSPEDFAGEVAFVIINSGMQNRVARGIWERVRPALEERGRIVDEFRHPGKRTAINDVWARRAELFPECLAALDRGPDDALAFLQALPWIGSITRYHLAKNFGVDCAKPDIWLERVAAVSGEDVQEMCRRLGAECDLKARTVDLLIWRACAERIVLVDDGLVLPNDQRRLDEWFGAWKQGA